MHAPILPLALLAGLLGSAEACSRVVYNASDSGADSRLVIGRSMDMVMDTKTTIWSLPAGMRRNGGLDTKKYGKVYSWTSRYGSMTTMAYDKVYTEGVNSEGLAGSTLYLGDSVYEKRDPDRPGIFVGTWLQYMLDSYATVAEAAKDVCPKEGGKPKFQVVSYEVVPSISSVMHVALTDLEGDNLILEFIKGEMTCFHSKNYTVMTNEPSFDQQLAINTYWKPIANESLPGTSRPADRFARLSHYNTIIPGAKDGTTAVSYAAGMIRAVSTPMLPIPKLDPGAADVWPTLYRLYTDLRDRWFYYESATSPMTFWIDVKKLDLSRKGVPKVLSLVDMPWKERVGDVTNKFVPVPKGKCIWADC